jgi:hypothetical protein
MKISGPVHTTNKDLERGYIESGLVRSAIEAAIRSVKIARASDVSQLVTRSATSRGHIIPTNYEATAETPPASDRAVGWLLVATILPFPAVVITTLSR